ncbi:MAG: SipW-dependent-type signal peptide-containing protein [Bacillota bacterium]|nr:SipW-dependent-type signal peptide-containing protein [Bacillota bacterium]
MTKKIIYSSFVIALTSLLVVGATMAWFTDSDDAGMASFDSGTLSMEAGASMIFGVEAITGDIYEIDLSGGGTYLLFDKTIGTTSDKYVNALAYDREKKRLYYTPENNKLYFYDFNVEQFAGNLAGGRTAGATFGRGYYWYVPQATNDLWRVSFNPDGSINTDVKFMDNFANGNFSFGDVALDINDNMLYGSASASTKVYFKIDLLTKIYTQIDTGVPNHMQISFGSDGLLYGHVAEGTGSTGTPKGWYTIDLVSGDSALLNWSPGSQNFNDLASNNQNNWNPSNTEMMHYFVKNTGSKQINVRVNVNGKWASDGLSSDNVLIQLDQSMNQSDWVVAGHTVYYLKAIKPGESVLLHLIVHLDGPTTGDDYQGQTFCLNPIFDAIQSSNYAPYHDWGVSYYGTP